MKLYEINEELARLVTIYENAEADDERAEAFSLLCEYGADIQSKAEGYARVMREKLMEIDALRAEEKRLERMRKSREALVAKLKETLQQTMTLYGNDKIVTSIGQWTLQKNPMSVEVIDENKINVCWLITQPPKVDKAGMLSHYKETGELIDGVEFVQKQSIRFR